MKLRITHYRTVQGPPLPRKIKDAGVTLHTMEELNRGGAVPAARGGATMAQLVDNSGVPLIQGVAYCNPCDPYNKKTGRELAVLRLLENIDTIVKWRSMDKVKRSL